MEHKNILSVTQETFSLVAAAHSQTAELDRESSEAHIAYCCRPVQQYWAERNYDTVNSFNSFEQKVLIKNIRHICKLNPGQQSLVRKVNQRKIFPHCHDLFRPGLRLTSKIKRVQLTQPN